MICRLCLKSYINLAQNIINSDLKCSELTLIESLYWIFGVEVDVSDPYSKFICVQCENVIRYVGAYRTLYQKNQLILQGKIYQQEGGSEEYPYQDIEDTRQLNFDFEPNAHQSTEALSEFIASTNLRPNYSLPSEENKIDISNTYSYHLFGSMNYLNLNFVKELIMQDENNFTFEEKENRSEDAEAKVLKNKLLEFKIEYKSKNDQIQNIGKAGTGIVTSSKNCLNDKLNSEKHLTDDLKGNEEKIISEVNDRKIKEIKKLKDYIISIKEGQHNWEYLEKNEPEKNTSSCLVDEKQTQQRKKGNSVKSENLLKQNIPNGTDIHNSKETDGENFEHIDNRDEKGEKLSVEDIDVKDYLSWQEQNSGNSSSEIEDEYKWIKDFYSSIEKCPVLMEFCQNSDKSDQEIKILSDCEASKEEEPKIPEKNISTTSNKLPDTEKWKGDLAATVLKIRQIKERLKNKKNISIENYSKYEAVNSNENHSVAAVSDKDQRKEVSLHAGMQYAEGCSQKCNLNQTKKACSKKKGKLEGNKEQKRKKRKNNEMNPFLRKMEPSIVETMSEFGKLKRTNEELKNAETMSDLEPQCELRNQVKTNCESRIPKLEIDIEQNSEEVIEPLQSICRECTVIKASDSIKSSENDALEKNKRKTAKSVKNSIKKNDKINQKKIMESIVEEHELDPEEKSLTNKTNDAKNPQISGKSQRKIEESSMVVEEKDHLANKVEQLSKLLNMLIILTNSKNTMDQGSELTIQGRFFEEEYEHDKISHSNTNFANAVERSNKGKEGIKRSTDLSNLSNSSSSKRSAKPIDLQVLECKKNQLEAITTDTNCVTDERDIETWKEQVSLALLKIKSITNKRKLRMEKEDGIIIGDKEAEQREALQNRLSCILGSKLNVERDDEHVNLTKYFEKERSTSGADESKATQSGSDFIEDKETNFSTETSTDQKKNNCGNSTDNRDTQKIDVDNRISEFSNTVNL